MSEPRRLGLVVAMGPGREIGRRGQLPWRLSEDLKHFKALTLGHAIVMGRATYESIGKPLPGRRNIVVSRTKRDFADVEKGLPHPEGLEVYASIEEAIRRARETDDAPFVIGGGAVYAAALPLASDLFVTHVSAEAAGALEGCDAFFPEVDLGAFELVEERPFATAGVTFRHYRRRR